MHYSIVSPEINVSLSLSFIISWGLGALLKSWSSHAVLKLSCGLEAECSQVSEILLVLASWSCVIAQCTCTWVRCYKAHGPIRQALNGRCKKGTILMLTREVWMELVRLYPDCHKWRRSSYERWVPEWANKFTYSYSTKSGYRWREICLQTIMFNKKDSYSNKNNNKLCNRHWVHLL